MHKGWWTIPGCVIAGAGFLAVTAEERPRSKAEWYQEAKPGLFDEVPVGDAKAPAKPAAKSAAAAPATAAPADAAGATFYESLFQEADRERAARAAAEDASAAKPAAATVPAAARATAAAPKAASKDSADALAERYRQLIQASQTEDPAQKPAASPVVPANYKQDAAAPHRRVEQIKATSTAPRTAPAKAPAPRPAATPTKPRIERAEPAAASTASAGPQHSIVTLTWAPKGECNLGQECQLALVAKNTGRGAALDVHVEAWFPASVQVVSAKPEPADASDHLTWKLGRLNPNEEQQLDVVVIPTKRGELATSAQVRFSNAATASFQVEEPQLKVAVKGPQEVSLGDPASQVVTVTNPGTGTARDVVIETLLPAGLSHASGKRLAMNIGSLASGESRSVRLALEAIQGGDQQLTVHAKSAGGTLASTAAAKIAVIAPSLDVKVAGPGLRYVNRNAVYTITVGNNSTAATNNVRVVEEIPAGFEFVKASKGGRVDASGKSVSWFVGRLEAQQGTELTIELAAREMGTHIHQVRAIGESGVTAQASAETKVDGVPSLTMEVRDLDDPVEVGTETAYEITIKNEGSKSAHAISLACELSAGVDLLNTDGPTSHAAEAGMILFKPVADLAAGDSLTYRVHVKGQAGGNLKFRARLTSESVEKPLVTEEVTKFYAD